MTIRSAVPGDERALAALAAITFPLACPPHTSDEAKAQFIGTVLSEERFAAYLADPGRVLLVDEAEVDGVTTLVGYTMLIEGEPTDADVAAALTLRPTVELSKVYVLPEAHGTGTAAALMAASLDAARERGAVGIWLGVNEENLKAQRFYTKSGFARVGRKRFLVGDRWEDDFVYEAALR